eukprot:gnl/TRDRNA2_/TRDRNA2_189429_c0_seq1.p1 gnl/TRDRNA2_/TRDRNA2_189429_c0~~gnl/TRDRNA2_/TRDRNA2_189429_c0_seq1.p1  ORF type:complete len:702 (-),score=89.86 gnl/TRDRNA2_/TRDRNA2_189429_c0_seq1:121-2172(-)
MPAVPQNSRTPRSDGSAQLSFSPLGPKLRGLDRSVHEAYQQRAPSQVLLDALADRQLCHGDDHLSNLQGGGLEAQPTVAAHVTDRTDRFVARVPLPPGIEPLPSFDGSAQPSTESPLSRRHRGQPSASGSQSAHDATTLCQDAGVLPPPPTRENFKPAVARKRQPLSAMEWPGDHDHQGGQEPLWWLPPRVKSKGCPSGYKEPWRPSGKAAASPEHRHTQTRSTTHELLSPQDSVASSGLNSSSPSPVGPKGSTSPERNADNAVDDKAMQPLKRTTTFKGQAQKVVAVTKIAAACALTDSIKSRSNRRGSRLDGEIQDESLRFGRGILNVAVSGGDKEETLRAARSVVITEEHHRRLSGCRLPASNTKSADDQSSDGTTKLATAVQVKMAAVRWRSMLGGNKKVENLMTRIDGAGEESPKSGGASPMSRRATSKDVSPMRSVIPSATEPVQTSNHSTAVNGQASGGATGPAAPSGFADFFQGLRSRFRGNDEVEAGPGEEQFMDYVDINDPCLALKRKPLWQTRHDEDLPLLIHERHYTVKAGRHVEQPQIHVHEERPHAGGGRGAAHLRSSLEQHGHSDNQGHHGHHLEVAHTLKPPPADYARGSMFRGSARCSPQQLEDLVWHIDRKRQKELMKKECAKTAARELQTVSDSITNNLMDMRRQANMLKDLKEDMIRACRNQF